MIRLSQAGTVLAVVLLSFIASGNARAQSTWQPTTSGSWNLASNWSPGGVPNGATFDAIFGGTTNQFITLDAAITINSLSFTNASGIYAISNGTGGSLALAGAGTINSANAGVINYLTATLGGSVGLNATGGGILALGGANTFAGATTIGSGATLQLHSLTGLGASGASNDTNIAAGGTLAVNVAGTVALEQLSLNGAGVGGNGALIVNANTTWSGAITVATDSTINVATGSTFTQSTSPLAVTGNLTKIGGGSLLLGGGITTGTGTLTINAGSVAVNATSQWNSGNITVNNGGVFQATGAGTDTIGNTVSIAVNAGGAIDWQQTGAETLAGITLNGTGISNTGALTNSATAAVASGVITAPVTLGGDSSIGVNFATSSMTLASPITGGFALTKVGRGTLNLNGANTYSGGTIISNGTLNLGAGGSLASGSNLIFNGSSAFGYTSPAAGVVQSLGTLTFTAGNGQITSTYGTSGNSGITVATLAPVAAGATGNFVVTGGSNGSSNKIALGNVAANSFIDPGLFFGGNAFAWNDAGGFVRAIQYTGTPDTGAMTTGTTTSVPSTAHLQITGAISAQDNATFTTSEHQRQQCFHDDRASQRQRHSEIRQCRWRRDHQRRHGPSAVDERPIGGPQRWCQ